MLADTEIWRQVAKKIDELRQDKVGAMAAGSCATHAEYMREVGYLLALKDVEQAAQDIFHRMTGAKDDEDDRGSVGDGYEN
jgi:hypothetical protein